VDTDPKRQEHFLDGLLGHWTISSRATLSPTSKLW
jgi:hypothetical protein